MCFSALNDALLPSGMVLALPSDTPERRSLHDWSQHTSAERLSCPHISLSEGLLADGGTALGTPGRRDAIIKFMQVQDRLMSRDEHGEEVVFTSLRLPDLRHP